MLQKVLLTNLGNKFPLETIWRQYYITTEFHYAKQDSRLSAYGGAGIEVSYLCYKNIKIST